MRIFRIAAMAALAFGPAPAFADEISDSITAALEAYGDGDIQYALDELAYATQLLNEMKAEGLQEYLPVPLDGWTMSIDEDAAAGLGFMGGGSIARGTYTGPGQTFTITLMADNALVTSMGAMLGNSQIMSSMGQIERINRVNFLNQDGDFSALIANRILVQAEDGDEETMIAHLETMAFRDMQSFGQ